MIRPTRTGPRRRCAGPWQLDVTFIDTADSYGPEVSEELIAEALYPYPEELVIATKGGLMRPGPGSGCPTAARSTCAGLARGA